MIGLITLGTKPTGKRSAGKPHAAFDVAGAGNVTMVAGLRSIAKAMGLPPAPTVRAPALDPTCERLAVQSRRPTHHLLQQFKLHALRAEIRRHDTSFPMTSPMRPRSGLGDVTARFGESSWSLWSLVSKMGLLTTS